MFSRSLFLSSFFKENVCFLFLVIHSFHSISICLSVCICFYFQLVLHAVDSEIWMGNMSMTPVSSVGGGIRWTVGANASQKKWAQMQVRKSKRNAFCSQKGGEWETCYPPLNCFPSQKTNICFFRFKHHFELLPKFNFQTESETVGPDIWTEIWRTPNKMWKDFRSFCTTQHEWNYIWAKSAAHFLPLTCQCGLNVYRPC